MLGHEGNFVLVVEWPLADLWISDETDGRLECAHRRGPGLGR